MSTDATLLRRYVEERDERAFAELVQRHLDLVYSAALWRTGGRTHLAEEIVSLEDGQLFLEMVGRSPKEPLFAASERKFFLRSEDAELEFLPDQKGRISSFVAKVPGEPQLKAVRKQASNSEP
jgi:hypothetical protein